MMHAVGRIRAEQPGTRGVPDVAFGCHREDPEGRERPEHSDQRKRLCATLRCQRVDRHMRIRRNPIGKSEVGNEAKHAGHLKSSHKQIQGGPVVVCIVRICHGVSFRVEGTVYGSAQSDAASILHSGTTVSVADACEKPKKG